MGKRRKLGVKHTLQGWDMAKDEELDIAVEATVALKRAVIMYIGIYELDVGIRLDAENLARLEEIVKFAKENLGRMGKV